MGESITILIFHVLLEILNIKETINYNIMNKW